MPLERTHVPAAQRQRAQIAGRADKFSASSVYAQVLGSGAPGAPTTLYLFTDQKRYLFNCGEGTQRLAHEHKVKLSRLEHVFITSRSWRHLGGLPGVSLTLQDVGVPNITLHGPPGLDELYHATRRFVIIKDMKVSMAPCSPSHDFEDNVMTVKYVHIGPDDNLFDSDPAAKKQKKSPDACSEFENDDTDYYSGEGRHVGTSREKSPDKSPSKSPSKSPTRGSPDRQPISQYMTKKKTEQLLSSLSKKSSCSVSYICTLKKRLGTLDLEACVARGVRPGPLLGLLKQGKDVLLEDGRLVLSKDVKTQDELGPVFIVLDVPNMEHLKESDFQKHFADGVNPPENVPALVVHFSPKNVVGDERYRSFLRKFGPTTQHLVVNDSNACSGSVAVHRMQRKLHLLDTDIFPLLRDNSIPVDWSRPPATGDHSDQLSNKIALAQFESIVNNQSPAEPHLPGKDETTEEGDSDDKLEFLSARTLTTFHLRPKRILDRSSEPKLDIHEYISETMRAEGFPEQLESLRRLIEARRGSRPSPSPASAAAAHPRVVFLGTGSCIPNKTRNTSAILLHLDEDRCMLLDCGEGTYGQMVRFYGPKKVNKVLASLRTIYVSHLHADHHIGLIGVLQGRRRALSETGAAAPPVHLLAPGQIMTWLSIYDQQFERIRAEFQLIPNQSLLTSAPADAAASAGMTAATLAAAGLSRVSTCRVAHCPNSFGVALETPAGHKITYSGDTIPCDELVALGEDSTLLIHEATMEDELAGEARVKMHSTTSQAMEIGRRMRARHTLLTHFSQRYARLPRLDARALAGDGGVGIAFDNMQVTMDDLDILPHMYDALRLMFAEHCEELELRAAKRARRELPRTPSAALDRPSATRGLAEARPATKGDGDDTAIADVSDQISKMADGLNAQKKNENRPKWNMSKPSIVLQKYTPRDASSPIRYTRTKRDTSSAANYILIKRENSIRNSKIPVLKTRELEAKLNSSNLSKDVLKSDVSTRPVLDRAAKCKDRDQTKDHSENLTGYGKPLVTPWDKKLTIQRTDFFPKTKSPINPEESNIKNTKVTHLSPSSSSGYGNSMLRKRISPTRNSLSQNASPTKLAPIHPVASNIKNKKGTHPSDSSSAYTLLRKSVSPTRNSLSLSASPTKLGSPTSHLPSGAGRVRSNLSGPLHSPRGRTRSPNKCSVAPKIMDRNILASSSIVKAAKEESKTKADLYKSAKYKEAARNAKSAERLVAGDKRDRNSEDLRRTKMRFRSKQFLMESKYDRIEGLNWISWK